MGYCKLCDAYSEVPRSQRVWRGGRVCLDKGALFKVCKFKSSSVKRGSLVRRPEGMKTKQYCLNVVLRQSKKY